MPRLTGGVGRVCQRGVFRDTFELRVDDGSHTRGSRDRWPLFYSPGMDRVETFEETGDQSATFARPFFHMIERSASFTASSVGNATRTSAASAQYLCRTDNVWRICRARCLGVSRGHTPHGSRRLFACFWPSSYCFLSLRRHLANHAFAVAVVIASSLSHNAARLCLMRRFAIARK